MHQQKVDLLSFIRDGLQLEQSEDQPLTTESREHYLQAKWWLSQLNRECSAMFRDYEALDECAPKMTGVRKRSVTRRPHRVVEHVSLGCPTAGV